MDSFNSKFTRFNWVSTLVEFSDDSKYCCIGSDEGIISCYDLTNMKYFEFSNHMKMVKYISIVDGLILSYAEREDEIVSNELIFD